MNFTIRHILSESHYLRPLAYKLASSVWLNNSNLYQHLYTRHIKSVQKINASFPKTVSIEGANFCNLSCAACGHKNMKRNKGVMSIEMYRNILKQLQAWPIESIFLSGYGEPLLDPHLEERISLAKTYGFNNIGMVSNGSLLSPEKSVRLISAGLDFMHISIDGITSETYEKLRPGGDISTLIQNIDNILSLDPRPRIFLQITIFNENEVEIDSIVKAWKNRVDRLIIRQALDWAGQVPLSVRTYSPHLVDRPQWPPCHYLWDQLNIFWDGTVPACCFDYETQQAIGNANKQSLQSIWQSPAIIDIRQKHNAGQRSLLPLCRQCRYYSVWW